MEESEKNQRFDLWFRPVSTNLVSTKDDFESKGGEGSWRGGEVLAQWQKKEKAVNFLSGVGLANRYVIIDYRVTDLIEIA